MVLVFNVAKFNVTAAIFGYQSGVVGSAIRQVVMDELEHPGALGTEQ